MENKKGLTFFYNALAYINLALICIGDIAIALKLQHLEYAFILFVIANIFAFFHFYMSKSYFMCLFALSFNLTAHLGIWNYFKDTQLSVQIILLTIFCHIFIIFFSPLYKIENKSRFSIKELVYTIMAITGSVLISFNISFFTVWGFFIWALTTPIGVSVSIDLKSKGFLYQVYIYTIIQFVGMYMNSENNEYIPLSIISILVIAFSYWKYDLSFNQNKKFKECIA